MDLGIKKAIPSDASLLATLGEQTFRDAFASFNSEEDMNAYVNNHFTEQALLSELAMPGAEFFLAYKGADVIGFAKVGTKQPPLEIATHKCMELERIYVLKGYQSLKVGERLLHHCIAKARAEEYEVVWLGVWEHNPRAVAFYQRFGFERFGEHNFQLGADVQTDWLMMLNLG